MAKARRPNQRQDRQNARYINKKFSENNNFMKTVGIIGGLGPETTSEFYLDLVFSCAKKEKSARPPIIISSVSLPYQIEVDLILKSEGMDRYIPYLVTEAQRLEKDGVYFVGRLANYKYFNMDEAFKNALDLFYKINPQVDKSELL